MVCRREGLERLEKEGLKGFVLSFPVKQNILDFTASGAAVLLN
jgi:hypothetical protein